MSKTVMNPASLQVSRMRAYLLLIAGVVGIGFSPALVKLLGLSGMGPSAIGFWRNLTGAMFLFFLALIAGRKLGLSRVVIRLALLAGLFFALDLNFWHRSVMLAGSGISTVIGNMQVFVTSVFGAWVFHEKLTRNFKLYAASAMLGVVLLTGVLDSRIIFDIPYLKGILYAGVTAFMYALYLISMKKSAVHGDRPDPLVFMSWIACFSAAFLLAGCVLDHGTFLPTAGGEIVLIILLGVGVQGICWWMIAVSMVRLQTHVVALILLLQPALAVLWGYVILDEVFTALQVCGVLLTLVSVYAGARESRKE